MVYSAIMEGIKHNTHNNSTKENSIRAITLEGVVVVGMSFFVAFSTSLSHAESLDLPSISLADSLNFDTSIDAAGTGYSLENTPKYLWVSDKLSLKVDNSESTSSRSSFASGGEYWAKNKWGISGSFSSNDESLLLGSPKNSELFNVDVNRQLLRSENKKNYLAVGLGWQSVDVDNSLDADGLRLSLLGKYSLAKRIQVYGTSSWFPEEIGISESALSGYNLEAGVLFKPKGSFSLQAGFRFYDFGKGTSSIDSDGSSIFTLGTKLSF